MINLVIKYKSNKREVYGKIAEHRKEVLGKCYEDVIKCGDR